MQQKIGDIALFMGPSQVGGKDELLNIIVEFIDGAKKRWLKT